MGNSSKQPTQDKFAKWLMDGIRKAGATAAIVYDRERFCLSEGSKDGTVLFLTNAYNEYCSAPEAMRPKVFQKYDKWPWLSRPVNANS